MVMIFWIVIGAIILGLLLRYNDSFVKGIQEKEQSVLDKVLEDLEVNGFEILQIYSHRHIGLIALSEKTEELVFANNNGFDDYGEPNVEIVNFKDIIDCELLIDDVSAYKKSMSGTLGRALVGGVLLGGVGALVGGLTSSSNEIRDIRKIDLKVIIRDLSNPSASFNFFTAPHGDSVDVALEEANKWKDLVSIIIDRYLKK
jgi:hypothetical protein